MKDRILFNERFSANYLCHLLGLSSRAFLIAGHVCQPDEHSQTFYRVGLFLSFLTNHIGLLSILSITQQVQPSLCCIGVCANIALFVLMHSIFHSLSLQEKAVSDN